jgi:hypothetical protein
MFGLMPGGGGGGGRREEEEEVVVVVVEVGRGAGALTDDAERISMPILRSVVGWGLSLVVLGVEEGSRTPSHPPQHRPHHPEKEDHITWEPDPDPCEGFGHGLQV